MAGEVTGKVCEAATVFACRANGFDDSNLHWGIRPSGMSITTDILLGKDQDAPDAAILVTHSISSMQSHKKFWRNIGELVELKTQMSRSPLAINIVFGDAQMRRLALITTSCMDLSIRVVDIRNGDVLMKDLLTISRRSSGLGREATLASLSERLTPISKGVLKLIGSQIHSCISANKSKLTSLWALARSHSREITRSPLQSSLTRGSAKFLIFDRSLQKEMFESAKARKALRKDAPSLAIQLGIVGGLRNRFIADGDMIRFACDYTIDDLMYLNDHAPMASLQRIAIEPLHAIDNLPHYTDYVVRNHSRLSSADGIHKAMNRCHRDPLSLCSLPVQIQNVWLVDYIMSIAKARRGGHNTFGQSQLAEEAGVDTGISSSGYRVFADWLNRREKGIVPESVLSQIAAALAREVSQCPADDIKRLEAEIRRAYIRTYLEIKLLTYENYDPIGCLIRRQLDMCRISYREESRLPSVFGEIGGEPGATSSVLITSTGDAYYWNAATDAGRDHKRKELEGRCVGIKWKKSSGDRGFQMREGIRRMCLVVDGTWQESDFQFLGKSGWDAIVYPTELGQLSSAIV